MWLGSLSDVAQKRGYRLVVVLGATVWCGAYLWYALVVGPEPAFWSQWLPGQLLSGIGVGATLPILGSAAVAAVPGGRFATASAVVSSARQLGGVLGIAILVVIIGTPTPLTSVDVLRNGWLFCAGCFALAAVGALFLGRAKADAASDRDVADPRARVHVPARESSDADGETLLPTPAPAVTTFVDRLPPKAREEILASGTRVEVPAGQWLFRQGDAAESMYIVVSGRLEVVIDDIVVRDLVPGAALGELGLLTDSRRSASVRARRDSSLIVVARTEFLQALEHVPWYSGGGRLGIGRATCDRAAARFDRWAAHPR